MSKKNRFTLVELLIVISIILILVGIAVPAYMIVMKKARESKARVQMKELQTAIIAYKNQYQYLPFYPANGNYNDLLVNEDDVKTKTAGKAYEDLIRTLRGTDADLNPRKTSFISNSGSDYVDPWGSPYYIALDIKGDGKISDDASTTDSAGAGNTTQKLYGELELETDVAIWSKGPDQKHSATDADPTNDDNIYSWKKK